MPEDISFNQTIDLFKRVKRRSFISRQPCDVNDAEVCHGETGYYSGHQSDCENEEYALDLVAAWLGISVVPSHSTTNHLKYCDAPG